MAGSENCLGGLAAPEWKEPATASEYDREYGDTIRCHRHEARARKPKLGVSRSTFPHLATQFELQVSKLRLTPKTYASSAQLRIWCEQNRNRVYVPEWLLEEWGMSVDSMFSDAA